ncbi:MAG: DUF935 family protein [Ignavibacteriales bacterium]|nr:DUF935 family protein [Ignavibacteriales bacterium]
MVLNLPAKYKDGISEDEQKKIFDGVEKIMTDTYGIIPESSDLSFVSSKSSTSEVFKKYLEFC